MSALKTTNFKLPGQTDFYRGKVRDVYIVNDDLLVIVATDRISAFDHVLKQGIPHKGQVLNQLAAHALRATNNIVPNWLLSTPHPNVSIGRKAKPFKIEMVVRGYLAGHAWREYQSGKRELCGEPLPDQLKEGDRLPNPIITPTTKAHEGHDEDISRAGIISKGIVDSQDYKQLEKYAYALFKKGSELARERGLILVDTKYEFGKTNAGDIVLIDEIHTPDSSRYFYLDGYEQRQKSGERQRQLSKEFVREWLIEHDFSGQDGQKIPNMPKPFISAVSQRYIELYERLTNTSFKPIATDVDEIENKILLELQSITKSRPKL